MTLKMRRVLVVVHVDFVLAERDNDQVSGK